MDDVLAARVLALARSRDLVGAEEIGRLGLSPAAPPAEVLEGLRLEAVLADSVLEELVNEASSDDVAPTLPLSSSVSAEALSPAKAPTESIGRYRIEEFLGAGAMGRVFRAHDDILGRNVALKLLQGDTPERQRRFVNEARSQARVDHPNVCKVYEAGTIDGVPFIAMQLIEGETLGRAARRLSLEQKVLLMAEAAEGVHAAHRNGLIHRDLKPANVLVEWTDEGDVRPYVVDFGLAREVEGPGMTVSGQTVGTPAYMAPEQASGVTEKIDRRSDVYGLGASLYELLTGGPPFAGGSGIDVLVKVLSEEPLAPRKRDRSIPADLETIVLKCLAKDPTRRYDSARALSEDLRRYLDGEPIQARRASVLYRIATKARKHRVAASVLFVSGAAVVALAAWALSTSYRSAERARLARRFGEDVEKVEGLLRAAHLSPPHDIRPDKARVRTRLDELKRTALEVGSVAEAPAAYAAGRGALALGDVEEADIELSKAWRLGDRSPDNAYALGLALGRRYQAELDILDAIKGKELREARRQEIERLYRDPAIRFLGLSRGVQMVAPEYPEGLIALYEHRYDAAVAKARAAFAHGAWLYEAKLLEGEARLAEGRDRWDRGDQTGASASFRDAETAFAEAARIGESDPRGDEGVCAVGWCRLGLVVYGTGESFRPILDAADAACRRALAVDPESVEAYLKLAAAHRLAAEARMRAGEDPSPDLDVCLDAAERATKLRPRDSAVWYRRAVVFQMRGRYESQHAKDPRPSFEAAEAAFVKCLEFRSGFVSALNSRGVTLWYRGQWEMRHDVDPRPSFDAAIKSFSESVETAPDYVLTYTNLGGALNDRGTYEASHGVDPRPTFDEARKVFETGLAKNPKLVDLWNNAGTTFLYRAEYEVQHDLDPRPSVNAALAKFDEAIRLNPGYAIPRFNRVDVTRSLARYMIRAGEDPTPLLQDGEKRLDALTAEKFQPIEVEREKAMLALLHARWDEASGRSPAKEAARAAAACRRVLALDPNDEEARRLLAEATDLEGKTRISSARASGRQ